MPLGFYSLYMDVDRDLTFTYVTELCVCVCVCVCDADRRQTMLAHILSRSVIL